MYDVEPEVAEGLAQVFGTDPAPTPAPGDWRSRRASTRTLFADLAKLHPAPDDVAAEDVVITGGAGQPMTVRVYRKDESAGGAVLLYLHGGGMIMGDLETHDVVCRTYASLTGLDVVAVDYRVAPEHPFPAPLDDCLEALRWIASRDAKRGFDRCRVVVGGDSAGGGLAAALALRARDEAGPRLAGLLLTYPMLDDRTYQQDVDLEEHVVWNYDDHVTAWSCYLGEPVAADAPGYATPLRAKDLSGLPPTYLDCGELDVFRQENLAFALRLLEAGVRLELHLYPAVPHAFEIFAPRAAVSHRAMANRARALAYFIKSDSLSPGDPHDVDCGDKGMLHQRRPSRHERASANASKLGA